MRESTGAGIAEVRGNCEADPLWMQARVGWAEIVVRKALTIWELRVALSGLNGRDLFEELSRMGTGDMIEKRDGIFASVSLIGCVP